MGDQKAGDKSLILMGDVCWSKAWSKLKIPGVGAELLPRHAELC